jgi:hypothetical protein
MKEKEALIVKDDHICPIAKTYCDNECCPVGSICNISSIIEDGISDTLPQTTRTMTKEKEKAIDLIAKIEIELADIRVYKGIVKKLALIGVDEIIKECCKSSEKKDAKYQDERINYWQQVKHEINNL